MTYCVVFSIFMAFLINDYEVNAQSFPLAIEEMRASIEKDTDSKFNNVTFKTRKVLKKEREKEVVLPVRKMSAGEVKVAAMLAANKARIQKGQAQSKNLTSKKSKDWITSKQGEQSRWVEQAKKSEESWRVARAKSLKKWAADRNRFKKDLPKYKKALTVIPEPEISPSKIKNVSKNKVQQWTEVSERTETKSKISFIAANFKQSIRDQGPRPTCAAFAAVRAIEIKSRAIGSPRDLSEQYFYYASKPECQEKPCSTPGSWPRRAFIASKQSVYPDIPLEKNCPYLGKKKVGNDTQIPLISSCRKGAAKLEEFSSVTDRLEIQEKIRAGHPVIGGFKLSQDFYLNTGYVFKNKNQRLGKDAHAQGHALLLIGVMELPTKLHDTQGRFCTIVANSWGEGWGKGGYACLSDAWFDQFRYNMAFLSVEKVSVI